MKERPILMSAPMVLANLAGRKTQTRRMTGLKKIPDGYECLGVFFPQITINGFVIPVLDSFDLAGDERAIAMFGNGTEEFAVPCRYGTIGDRLWVRETCIIDPVQIRTKNGLEWRYDVEYKADGKNIRFSTEKHCDDPIEKYCKPGINRYRPSIHMPRWASRIILEITNIRVERLQDISWDDCMAEGVLSTRQYGYTEYFDFRKEKYTCSTPRESYDSIIDSINGAKAWDNNPYVWVIEYKIVEIKGGDK